MSAGSSGTEPIGAERTSGPPPLPFVPVPGPDAAFPADFAGPMLTDEQRRPLLDADGRTLLHHLLEHVDAPRYNHTCGDRLTAAGLAQARAFDAEVATAAPWVPGRPPPWVPAFVERCLRTVPAYRAAWGGGRTGAVPARLEDLPTVDRDDLVRAYWSFVPDDHPLDEMVVYTTTGTTDGSVAYIPSTPVVATGYLSMLRAALRTRGLTLDGGRGRTAVALVCWQRSTYTYASISSFLDQAAVLKLNLNPNEWPSPESVVRFLDELDPEIVTGDPVAVARRVDLPVAIRPKALLSSALTLLPALRDRVQERFGCPVIDVYGMNEAGPIAAATPDGSAHVLLQPRLYVEILDPGGRSVPVGERGEITLTGGFNPALPLLRYRTGDHGALENRHGTARLVGLEGRRPVLFEGADGGAVNTIDATVALRPFPLARYRLHQHADRTLVLTVDPDTPGATDAELAAAVAAAFGGLPVRVERRDLDEPGVTYTSDLEGGGLG
jgi:phenylacetate-CoA ligase